MHRVITLAGPDGFENGLGRGGKELLPALDQVAIGAVLLRFAGRSDSRASGALLTAVEPRLVGIESGRVAKLHYELPQFGDSLPAHYRQRDLWAERPAEHWTAFELLAESLADVRAGEGDSERFDRALLRRLGLLGASFRHGVERVGFEDVVAPGQAGASVDAETLQRATELVQRIPRSRPARVEGVLDVIRHSAPTFVLLLDDGSRIRGVWSQDETQQRVQDLFGQRVVVDGSVVYRPSGKPLRIEARSIEAAGASSSLFSRVPPPREKSARSGTRRLQTERTGVNAVWGTWSDDASDDELLSQLREIRRG